jgi:hypothetical protein
MTRTGYLSIAALLGLTSAACDDGLAVDDQSPRDETQTVAAAATVDLSQPISVRIISIAGPSCSPMSDTNAQRSIDAINAAGAENGGLRWRLWRHDYAPLAKDLRGDLPSWNDLSPLWTPMGISVAAGQDLQDRVARSWSADQRLLTRWLTLYRKYLMPNQVVAFQGCDGGVEMGLGGYFSGVGNFAHEMGHGFNLSHSFEMSTAKSEACKSWDLVYAARGRGIPNVYFKSHAACDDFFATQSYKAIYRIDGRNEDSHGGRQRRFSGGIATVQHPRCSDCGVDLGFDQPADDGVERYSTGDWQIAGYARLMNGSPAVNALTYCSMSGCPSQSFYAKSQIDIMKQTASDNSWVFNQGDPAPINKPAKDCAYLSPDEGLNRDNPLYSCDGRFRLYLQADGNLVLSQKASDGAFSKVLWKTNPLVAGTDTTDIRLIMQQDGNLVVYDNARSPLWNSGTFGHPGAYMKLSDSGDLTVRTPDGSSFYWHTGTGGH